MSLHQALQQARLERHWTQQQVADQLGITRQTLALWEQGATFPDPVACQKLCAFFGKTAAELGLLASDTSGSIAHCWFIPLPRNRFFSGREAELLTLSTQFSSPENDTQSHVQAICGPGGVGKTQLALEYAYRFREDYATVLWLRAETSEMLFADLLLLQDFLDLPEKQERAQDKLLSTARSWLGKQTSWLLILDNLEDFTLLRALLPFNRAGHVLLTTHQQAAGAAGIPLNLQAWSDEEGALFLLHRAELLPQQARLDAASDEQRTLALTICQELGGLPLALDQAGAYMDETGCSLAGYRQHMQERLAFLLARRGSEHLAHPDSVTTTILIALGRIEREMPAAADLLRLCAFLAPDAIPEALITRQKPDILGPLLAHSITDPFGSDALYAALKASSLLELNMQTRLFSIHRLVQMVLIFHMDNANRQQWARRALLAVYQAFPLEKLATSSADLFWSDRLLPHALLTLTWAERFLSEGQIAELAPKIADLLFQVSNYLLFRGYYQKARPLLERCLILRERLLGSDHSEVAELRVRLGYLLRSQGQHASAEAEFERALAIYEQMSSPAHSTLIALLANLAMLSLDRGQYQQAEAFMKRVIAIEEQEQGAGNILPSLSDLAIIYRRQGRYEEARALLLHALHLKEQSLGTDHPNLVATLNNLANFYLEQDKYEEAQPIYARALQICQQSARSSEPEVALIVLNLGELLRKQGNYEESEAHYLRASDILEQTVGARHLLKAYVLHGLALLRAAQGRQQEAESLLCESLQIWEQECDEPHADLADILHDLGLLYLTQGKEDLALRLFERALQIREEMLSPTHPTIALSLYHLARLYAKSGRKEKALSSGQRALALREQALGPSHPETVLARDYLKALQAELEEEDQR